MKILYFSQIYLRQGGGEKNLLQLVKSLYQKNEIFVAAPMEDFFEKELEKFSSVKILNLPGLTRLSLKNFLVYKKIKKIIKENKIEIVQTINPRARLLAVILKRKLNFKLIHIVHSSPFLYQKNFLKNFIFKKIEKFLNKRTDRIIFVSQNTKDIFLKENLLSHHNWQVVYNGIDLSETNQIFNHAVEIKKQIFQELGLVENKNFLITFIGRLSFEKGLFNLIKAGEKVIKNFPNVKFILIGDGQEKQNLIKEIEKRKMLDYFLFLGWQKKEKVYQILSASRIFVLPSFYETFSYTVLEAMALGIPIVATNVGGVKELIEHNFNGLLVEKDNPVQIVLEIKKLLQSNELAEKFIKNGLEKSKNFSEEKMLEEMEKVYHSFLKN